MPSVKVQGPAHPIPHKARFSKWVFPTTPTHWKSSIKTNQHRSLTLVKQSIRNDSFLTQREGPSTHTGATTWAKRGRAGVGPESTRLASFGVLSNSSCPVSLGPTSSLGDFPPVWWLQSPSGPPERCSSDFLSFVKKKSGKANSRVFINIALFLSASVYVINHLPLKILFSFLGGYFSLFWFIHLFELFVVHSISKYSLSACTMPGSVLDAGDTRVRHLASAFRFITHKDFPVSWLLLHVLLLFLSVLNGDIS